MSHLIDDLLQLTGADSHQWTLCMSDLEPDTLLLELYEKYLPLTREKQLQLSLSLPEQMLPAASEATLGLASLSPMKSSLCTTVRSA